MVEHTSLKAAWTRGELRRPDPHGVGLEEQAHAALAEEAVHLPDHLVEPRDGPQGAQRRAVGGVLPGT